MPQKRFLSSGLVLPKIFMMFKLLNRTCKKLIEKNLGNMIAFSNMQFFNLFRVHSFFVVFCSSQMKSFTENQIPFPRQDGEGA